MSALSAAEVSGFGLATREGPPEVLDFSSKELTGQPSCNPGALPRRVRAWAEVSLLPVGTHLPGDGVAASEALEKSGRTFGKGMLMVLPL